MPAVDDEVAAAADVPTLAEALTAAVQFLTRVPLRGPMGRDPAFYAAALRRSVIFFPLVGGTVGLVTAGVAVAAARGFDPLVAALIAISVEALLTGAFHEDALADTCDALGGGWTPEQTLEILRDSRLGTYGTLALIVGVGLRTAAIASLLSHSAALAAAAIVASAALGRMAIVAMMALLPPIAGRDSHARDVAGTQSLGRLFVAAAIGAPLLLPLLWLAPLRTIVGVAAVLVFLLGYRRSLRRRLGGTTGDLLGCSGYVAQVVVLLAVAWGLDG